MEPDMHNVIGSAVATECRNAIDLILDTTHSLLWTSEYNRTPYDLKRNPATVCDFNFTSHNQETSVRFTCQLDASTMLITLTSDVVGVPYPPNSRSYDWEVITPTDIADFIRQQLEAALGGN